MESIPVEANKTDSNDIIMVKKEEIKSVDEEVSVFFEIGDGKSSVVEELLTSGESLESISAVSTLEEDDDQEIDEHPNTLTTIRRVYFQQEPLKTDFIRKVWTAFLTFHVFVIPAIIGMILSVITKFGTSGINDPYEDIKYSVMLGFLGSSVLIGLPFHMLALADLEETVNDIMLDAYMENNPSNCHPDSDETVDYPPFF